MLVRAACCAALLALYTLGAEGHTYGFTCHCTGAGGILDEGDCFFTLGSDTVGISRVDFLGNPLNSHGELGLRCNIVRGREVLR